MNKELRETILKVLDYYYEEEENHFLQCEPDENHIFHDLKKLKQLIKHKHYIVLDTTKMLSYYDDYEDDYFYTSKALFIDIVQAKSKTEVKKILNEEYSTKEIKKFYISELIEEDMNK